MSLDRLVGRRVVLRYRLAEPIGGKSVSDLVGELTTLTDAQATVQTRRGPVTVPRAAVQALRPVAANRAAILDLQRICRLGWRARERSELHGWELYADRGWTGRANSVLPLRTPDRPIEQLLSDAGRFYADRGLPLQIQVPMPARGLLDAELAARCWQVERPTIVLTRTSVAASNPPGAPAWPSDYRSEARAEPDAAWLSGYHYRGGPLPEHAAELLARHDRVRFVRVRGPQPDAPVVAVARGAVDEGWLGLTSVEVHPAHRRLGLARALMADLLDWGAEQGAQACYLQVEESNTPALALYGSLGFSEHHRYHYRIAPADGTARC